MALTYNGVTPKEITYNGATVKTVVCNGVTIWQRNKEFTLSTAYASHQGNMNVYTSATATTAAASVGGAKGDRFLLLTETATNGRVPILYYDDEDNYTWKLYWTAASYMVTLHTFTVSTDSKIIMSTASSGTYIDVCTDATMKTIQRTLQPTCPFFEYYSETTNSAGAKVYYVRTVDMKDNAEFIGYVFSGYKSTICDLDAFNVIDLV